MHLHHYAMLLFSVAEHHKPHAALTAQVEGPPRIRALFRWIPDQRWQHVCVEPHRAAPTESHPATEERVSPGRRLHHFPQKNFLERAIDNALQKEAHRVTGPVVSEHQLFERRQRPSGRGIGQFGVTGGSRRGIHGGVEDTFAPAEQRIWQEFARQGPGAIPVRNR